MTNHAGQKTRGQNLHCKVPKKQRQHQRQASRFQEYLSRVVGKTQEMGGATKIKAAHILWDKHKHNRKHMYIFKYLGTIFAVSGDQIHELNARIAMVM